MRLPFRILDVFTDTPLAGNQLAVFPEAGGLTGEQMQRIARELNFSETTFVAEQSDHRAKVRIFTPEVELPFAGHPSLGTAAVMRDQGRRGRVVLELGVGEVPVEVEPTAYGARCELAAPPAQRLPLPVPVEALAPMLGLRPEDLDPSLPPELWTCGNAFLFVPVRSRERVAASRCPAAPLQRVVGLMPFALEGPLRAHARVFCPGAGVPEDPATGSANAPFAAYLYAARRLGEGEVIVTSQGVEMGRPSRLEARMLRGPGSLLRPHVAGGVVFVAEGQFTI